MCALGVCIPLGLFSLIINPPSTFFFIQECPLLCYQMGDGYNIYNTLNIYIYNTLKDTDLMQISSLSLICLYFSMVPGTREAAVLQWVMARWLRTTDPRVFNTQKIRNL